MTAAPDWLLEFKSDVFSQTGEDGIIEKILLTVGSRDYWCVEFGAWDGVLYSNTRHLIENAGYSAVLIEANASKARELRQNYSHNPKVIPLNTLVGFGNNDNLDVILAGTPVPKDFDFLSIDVDGNDYHLWKAISSYSPKVVCIEFNPTIPTDVSFLQPADPSVRQGAGLLPLVELGKVKGYELVCVLQFNAFFVKSGDFQLFGISDNRAETLRKDLSLITYVFCGYDGQMFLSGFKRLPWHRLPMNASRIQHLPSFLRKYPDDYSALERFVFDLLFFRKRLLQGIRPALGRLVARVIGKRNSE